jgi:hypothetical protein
MRAAFAAECIVFGSKRIKLGSRQQLPAVYRYAD